MKIQREDIENTEERNLKYSRGRNLKYSGKKLFNIHIFINQVRKWHCSENHRNKQTMEGKQKNVGNYVQYKK